MKTRQSGNVLVGIIIGVVLGLAVALAVAVYVTKVPVPFMNKGQNRNAEQDAAETRKNKDWDPNAPLYGKNPARAMPPASGASASAAGAVVAAPVASGSGVPVATIPAPPLASPFPPSSAASRDKQLPPAVAGRATSADPLGDLAMAKSQSAQPTGGDPFLYFVQVGAFRTAEDAEAQRAKLALLGFDAKVNEREQSGRQVFRVRVGPFEKKDDADRQKERLDATGVETALVRVQR
ncbi:SPOR domain-containing protein [Caenimonas koreensis]|uniref:Sporulation protein n=1 Tax=Caenimonas koreensis DSM 17982 TaxID=1121255 RepID=A0A844BFI7_9BURK|nr:SPOR domain-containing protein [Caenimonas koreensis]MRD49221.1 sporulation protein [Caenimonas koreensis DSM 17982]